MDVLEIRYLVGFGEKRVSGEIWYQDVSDRIKVSVSGTSLGSIVVY